MSRYRSVTAEAHNGRAPGPDERARKQTKRTATRRAEWFAAQIASTTDPFAQLWHACRYAQAVGKALAADRSADPGTKAAAVQALARDIARVTDERNKQWLR